MANEAKYFAGTPKTLEANGASISNNNVGQADDAAYSPVSDGAGYLWTKFVFSGAFSVAPTENTTIDFYARPINISSTNDSEVPENGATAFKGPHRLGSVVLNNVTTTQYAEFYFTGTLHSDYEVYPHNAGTGQTLSSGWTLVAVPLSPGPT